MYAFRYHRAASLADARLALAASADGRWLAGGQTLLASLKLRLAQPDVLVDLGRLADLRGIARTANVLRIAAMSRHAEVAESAVVQDAIPALAHLAANIGDPMVRRMGTLGGSIANNDPAADYPAALLGLDATIVTDQRRIAAADFFRGLFETALAPGELVTAVDFPVPQRAAYVKFRHPASRFALVGVFVAATADGPRVAVTGAGACVFRASTLEQALARRFHPDALQGLALPPEGMNSDLQATAEYRAHLAVVMARRAVAQAISASME